MGIRLAGLADDVLLRDLKSLVARDRRTTSELLAHLAEVDDRRLYLPAAYPSMFAYCVGELGFSEDVAFKRIRAARTSRQFPQILDAIAAGRLTLSAVVLLHPHLVHENANELLEACEGMSNAQIERLLVERTRQPERILPGDPQPAANTPTSEIDPSVESEVAVRPVSFSATKQPSSVVTAQPQRLPRVVRLDPILRDKLRHAQDLLRHKVPSGNASRILELAVDALIAQTEKQRFATTAKPRPTPRPSNPSRRHVPAEVRRQVWIRDEGRCTFTSSTGTRCSSRTVEFDHALEFARGGQATTANIRLRCRAHNQYTAERAFGVAFMQRKRASPLA